MDYILFQIESEIYRHLSATFTLVPITLDYSHEISSSNYPQLVTIPDEFEIRKALKNLGPLKSPGHMAFTLSFIKKKKLGHY